MHPTRSRRGAGLVALATLSTLTSLTLTSTPAGATANPKPLTGLASVATTGQAGNGLSLASRPSLGARFVAFQSNASNLVAGDTNGTSDVFVRDTLAATTTRVSVSTAGVQGNGSSDQPAVSANGRYVVFRSAAGNLAAGDTNGATDIFWRDLRTGTTKRVNLADASITEALGGGSSSPSVSDDGSEVVFQSLASNLVPGDTNGESDVFVRNVGGAVTERISVTSAEAQLSAGSTGASASGNGRWVVFESATAQIATDTNAVVDVFLRDRVLGTTERVSIANDESQATAKSQVAAVSATGRYVAFQSDANGIANDADNAGTDVFRRDRVNGTTVLVTRSNGGVAANQGGTEPSISTDGSRVAFSSNASNLVAGDTNGTTDVFVRDLDESTTVRRSVTTLGSPYGLQSYDGAISPDGGSVSFTTLGDDGYGVDANDTHDIVWRGTYQLGPFADSTGLIQRNAKDFTGAPLPFGELVAQSDRVLNGTASPSSIIDDLAHGSFDDHRGPVMRLYWSFFHRVPDQGGLDHWVGKRAAGTKLQAIAAAFAGSSEFKNTYGSLDNSGFVALVYQNVLGRAPDAPGLAHWVASLQAGASRGDLMTAFSEASEGKRLMRAEVDSFLISLGMFGRLPTAAELQNDVNALDADGGQPTEVLILSNLQLGAYANRIAAT